MSKERVDGLKDRGTHAGVDGTGRKDIWENRGNSTPNLQINSCNSPPNLQINRGRKDIRENRDNSTPNI